ncbi:MULTISPECIES: phytase [unclassified Sphingopyxis]|uniref:phytase n=1 Tax=unclassified Sphingopyxis TaxID=2614943 RepID=UPI00073741C5|nr:MULTISPECIES: phytase [unclassified Sphingopyxis]KTE33504.1 3-phytase [Sphingopyxis sp. HIX]KTE83722.1 3-phytase [Sphingopyxis sp. HXXIV]
MTKTVKYFAAFGLASALAGCGAKEPVFFGLPPVPVTASGETDPVGTGRADAADDPAIWVDPANPNRALIVATDKKAGIHVYDLSGKDIAFIKGGLVNNVDVVGNIVAASDRNDGVNAHIALFRLDPDKPSLTPLGRAAAGTGEAYGFCLKKTGPGEPLVAALIIKDGTVRVGPLTIDGAAPTFAVDWEAKVPTQAEGCVFDDDTLYVGEEDAGIWRLTRNSASLVARIDNQRLVADVEGLATIDHKGQRYLLASSQGDNAYAVFKLPSMDYVGRFAVTAGAFGATSETDGIEAVAGNFGAAYPDGIFLAQDGDNAPKAQNFKLVRWDEIAAALGL